MSARRARPRCSERSTQPNNGPQRSGPPGDCGRSGPRRAGALLTVAGRLPLLRELGHLPGDIRIERENFSCFFPLVSMLLVSLLLSLVLNVILRLLNR